MEIVQKTKFINLLEKKLRVNIFTDLEIAEGVTFDFAIPAFFILIQCCYMPWEKQNIATMMGWRILRFTPVQLCTNVTIETIKATIQRSCEFTTVNNNVKF